MRFVNVESRAGLSRDTLPRADYQSLRRYRNRNDVVGEDRVVGAGRDAEVAVDAVVQCEPTLNAARCLLVRARVISGVVYQSRNNVASIEATCDSDRLQQEPLCVEAGSLRHTAQFRRQRVGLPFGGAR